NLLRIRPLVQFWVQCQVGLKLFKREIRRLKRVHFSARPHASSHAQRVPANICSNIENHIAWLNQFLQGRHRRSLKRRQQIDRKIDPFAQIQTPPQPAPAHRGDISLANGSPPQRDTTVRWAPQPHFLLVRQQNLRESPPASACRWLTPSATR